MLGGDCTVTLGVLAGLQRVEPDTALAYFDGDADLGTPGQGTGILDAMGIAHLLGLAETDLTSLFASRPPIAESRLAVLGYDEGDPESFTPGVFAARAGLTHFPDRAVRADPAGCARAALDALAGAGRLIVHFDVDAVDSGDLPLANFPHYGTGVPLAAARQALTVLFGAPRLSAVVLTEVNPSYDPDGDSLARYIEAVARRADHRADEVGRPGRHKQHHPGTAAGAATERGRTLAGRAKQARSSGTARAGVLPGRAVLAVVSAPSPARPLRPRPMMNRPRPPRSPRR